MAKQDVELVRSAIEAFNRRDLETLAQLVHDDFEFVSVLAAVDAEGATYRGRNAWTSYFKAMDETWNDWHAEDPQLFDGGENRVACVFRIAGTGRHSNASVDRHVGIAYYLLDRKLWRMRSYMDPDDALRAVGLRD